MTDPAGNQYRYEYDPDRGAHLQRVIYPDSTPENPADNPTRQYHYAEEDCPNALTGIVDESGNPFATFTYDPANGCRATSTQHAGGANATTLEYLSDRTRVTDALGTVREYLVEVHHGRSKVKSVDQPCASCGGGSISARAFDANGNVKSETDFNGNSTCRPWDPARNLELVRAEGLTGPCPADLDSWVPSTAPGSVERKITTQWHPTFRLPSSVAEPKRMTTYEYEPATGRLLSRRVQATADETGGAGFGGAAVGAARVWTYGYLPANTSGPITQMAENGPRTDGADDDLTVYDYYPATETCIPSQAPDASTTGCRGRLSTLTRRVNAGLSLVTRYTRYNAHGQPEDRRSQRRGDDTHL